MIKPKSIIWSLLMAFMIAWHNVYHEENRLPNDIAIEVVIDHVEEDAADL